ncbi:MAG: hypothetical protein J7621_21135 [Niastella sp.]|nr:hypothetical protein [Niastella sp.]
MRTILAVGIITTMMISCGSTGNEQSAASTTTVTEMPSPASDSCSIPWLTTDPAGTVYLSWVEKKNGVATLKYASLSKEQWSRPLEVSAGKNWFVNWADYPIVVSDGKGTMMAHYLEKSDAATFAYNIKLVVSADSGKTWSAPSTLHDDKQKAEHGFVTMLPFGDRFFAAWLDGRNSPVLQGAGHEGHHGQMTVRSAILAKNGQKEAEWELDGRVCDCCQTTAAITTNGPVVVYRDRSDEEVRDMAIVRYVNNQWTSPQIIYPDNWKIKGCPVNGPRMDAIGNNLAVAWFSMQDSLAQVKVIFSADGGEHFGKPVRIDEGKPVGRVDLLLIDNTTAMVSWMEGAAIKAAKVHADGKKEPSFIIAQSSEARSGGFPQMTKQDNKIIFAWTDNKAKTIRVAVTSL